MPKKGKIVVEIYWVSSLYKRVHSRQNPICHRKKNQNWRKIFTTFIVSNVIDGIKIKLIERCQLKVNRWLYTAQWFHKFCWRSKNYLLEKGNKWIRTACAFNRGTTRKREKTQYSPVFIYYADWANLLSLVTCADSFTIRYKMKFWK